jgi:predicted DNA-binding protein (MmcQ/YjbR family)
MDDLNTLRAALLARPDAQETYPFDPITLVAKIGGKMFALLATTAAPLRLSLKVDPDYGEVLRASFPAIEPGYHLNKRHWVTLTLDGSLEPTLVQELIEGSYHLVVQSLPRSVRAQLAEAPTADSVNEGGA